MRSCFRQSLVPSRKGRHPRGILSASKDWRHKGSCAARRGKHTLHVELPALSNTALTSDCAQKWASNEQKGMSAASAAVAEAMAKGNQDYEAKMGFRYTSYRTITIMYNMKYNATYNDMAMAKGNQDYEAVSRCSPRWLRFLAPLWPRPLNPQTGPIFFAPRRASTLSRSIGSQKRSRSYTSASLRQQASPPRG
jgi:hypothetical protein